MQIGFNAANVALSLGASLLSYRALLQSNILFRPALLAFSAAVYFINQHGTGLVHSVAAARQEAFGSVRRVVFLVVSVLPHRSRVSRVLPAAGTQTDGVEAWLVVLPLLYLVHFFYGRSMGRRPGAATARMMLPTRFTGSGKAFIGVVVGLGIRS